MSKVLEGLKGVVCMMDDIVVFGSTREEHDTRLQKVLSKIKGSGLTLNSKKCKFRETQLEFLGHIISAHGVKMDSNKVKAILEMPEPQDVSSLRRFMGMVNQLGKFTKNLTDLTEPLRGLLCSKNDWMWGPEQSQAFQATKSAITSAPTLTFYNPSSETKVSADSSSYGLGAVLLQKVHQDWHPVAFASRSLTPTERRYAQIEKEALAATWASEKFSDYLTGKRYILETDHKPLIPLLGSKDVDQLPVRIQRFRLRLMRFDYQIIYVSGKNLYTADTLSRAPQGDPLPQDEELQKEVSIYANHIMTSLPASDALLEKIRRHQEEDEVCRQIRDYVEEEWPDKYRMHGALQQFWPYRADLTIVDGILMYASRIFIPSSLRLQMLDRIHEGHQGIQKCRMKAQDSVWWPGISQQVYDLVVNCRECAKLKGNPHPEPLLPTAWPLYPWQKVATDLFEFQGSQYILVVDYFSRYIEVSKLRITTSAEIIHQLKRLFARHGIPETVISDNGPQYTSNEFATFGAQYGFTHLTSSPGHPSGNGEAERAVRTVKQLLKPAGDPYLALLSYRSTPHKNG